MNIGIINFFPMRPHVEHMYFLSSSLKELGHSVHYLNCKGGKNKCYYKIISKGNDQLSCFKCKLGGLKSYAEKVFSIDIDKVYKIEEKMNEWPSSSSYTAFRVEEGFESLFEEKTENLRLSLLQSVASTYNQTKEWISNNNIDFVFLFNGRMDILRAAYEACIEMNVKVQTIERTWFGDGLQVNTVGNCLSLYDIEKMSSDFMSKPLTDVQLKRVASNFLPRFRNESNNEWRSYNKKRENFVWNTEGGGYKCLILPSSKNEVLGHPDWKNLHSISYKDVFLKCIDKLGIERKNVILRGHPNWSEKIGAAEGSHINDDYKQWAEMNGINYIESSHSANTLDLISQADVLIVNGSSSAYEAAFLGTPTLLVSKCFYHTSGITKNIFSDSSIEELNTDFIRNYNHKEVLRKALRFIYIHGFRYPQFFNNVKAITTTEYLYKKTQNFFHDLSSLIEEGALVPSDNSFSDTINFEDDFIKSILNQEFNYLKKKNDILGYQRVNRRLLYRPLDWIRSKMKRGDL